MDGGCGGGVVIVKLKSPDAVGNIVTAPTGGRRGICTFAGGPWEAEPPPPPERLLPSPPPCAGWPCPRLLLLPSPSRRRQAPMGPAKAAAAACSLLRASAAALRASAAAADSSSSSESMAAPNLTPGRREAAAESRGAPRRIVCRAAALGRAAAQGRVRHSVPCDLSRVLQIVDSR